MRLFVFGILGLLIQGAGLAAFMLVSRSSIADFGKPAIMVITGLAICTLLWEGVRRSKGILAVCLLPFTLAVGYTLAFHLLGVLGFPGLLSDAWPPSLDFFLSVLRVTGNLLVLYGLTTVLFFAISRSFRKIRLYANQHSPKLT
jgi:FtsH-binding integral membrane protein